MKKVKRKECHSDDTHRVSEIDTTKTYKVKQMDDKTKGNSRMTIAKKKKERKTKETESPSLSSALHEMGAKNRENETQRQ